MEFCHIVWTMTHGEKVAEGACHLIHQHCPNGTSIPHRLLHPPIQSLTSMPTTNTSCQQGLLVWRYLQLRQLTMTNMSGHQNKVSVPQVVERQCQTMGIALLKEQSGCAIQHMDICMRGLDKVKVCPSTNDEMTYLVLVLVENQRRRLPVELNGTSSSIDALMR